MRAPQLGLLRRVDCLKGIAGTRPKVSTFRYTYHFWTILFNQDLVCFVKMFYDIGTWPGKGWNLTINSEWDSLWTWALRALWLHRGTQRRNALLSMHDSRLFIQELRRFIVFIISLSWRWAHVESWCFGLTSTSITLMNSIDFLLVLSCPIQQVFHRCLVITKLVYRYFLLVRSVYFAFARYVWFE